MLWVHPICELIMVQDCLFLQRYDSNTKRYENEEKRLRATIFSIAWCKSDNFGK